MNPITIQNPDEILTVLADVTLRGTGFTTESLLDYVLEEGLPNQSSSMPVAWILLRFSRANRMPGPFTRSVSGSAC